MFKNQKKALLISMGSLVALVIVISSLYFFFYFTNGSKTDTDSQVDTSNLSESSISNQGNGLEQNSSPLVFDSSYIENFKGEYKGTSAFFSSAFQFPNSTFKLNDDGSFLLNANNLDLIVTQIETLKVGEVYPLLNLEVYGTTSLTQDGDVVLSVTSLSPTFTIADQLVETNMSQTLLVNLSSAFNLVIPQPDTSTPLIITTTMVGTKDGKLNISNVAQDATDTSPVTYLYFDGSK